MGEVKYGNDGLIQATVTITPAMLPHVREQIACLVGSKAAAYAEALDNFHDPRAPFAIGGHSSTPEKVRATRGELLWAQGLLDQVGLDGLDGDDARELTAPVSMLGELAQDLIELGAGMLIGETCLYGDMTREGTDRWYHEETGVGFALRDALTAQSECGVPA